MGSYVEVYLIDRRRPDHADMLATSWKYLRIAWVHEPIGPHYLRRLLVSLKFELNMFVAVMISLIGVGRALDLRTALRPTKRLPAWQTQ